MLQCENVACVNKNDNVCGLFSRKITEKFRNGLKP